MLTPQRKQLILNQLAEEAGAVEGTQRAIWRLGRYRAAGSA